jgi:hypothetical protein
MIGLAAMILLSLFRLVWKYLVIMKVLRHNGPVEIELGWKMRSFRIKKEK